MIKKCFLPIVVGSMSVLAGCQSSQTSHVYSQSEARTIQAIQEGTIIELEAVTLEGSQSGLGGIAGGAVGGIAGSGIGRGHGSDIAAIGGAVLGSILGNMAEEKATRKQGVNITIRLTNGQLISVVQEVDPSMVFQNGEHVRIYTQNGTSRVAPM
ncbi:glycine zipper 2TM domain-containing protein [Parendozoicomonas sp. Alg238-R29]|uniref:glycine zipper 2TM domain-containing protein n=1 Tax=Parendozoicomonas sp. Alg238-R29 TaxID=2993446 RepID=UPI00248DDE84|nr:glycine zipper 2TM domain-containing protein [Parendozoicomonas sp. Alg238-R29]